MKYTINKNIPYTFKDVTGLADVDKIGQSIFEGDKLIGGICFLQLPSPDVNIVHLSAIEILPELRGQGRGTEFMKEFLSDIDLLEASAQNIESLKFWRTLEAKEYLAVCYPGEENKEKPRVHTVSFYIVQPSLIDLSNVTLENVKKLIIISKAVDQLTSRGTPRPRQQDNELFK